MKNKIFTRIIITTLLCAFLTLNVGKVTRISALADPVEALSPVFDTQIYQLKDYIDAGGLTDPQLDLFYVLAGTLALSQAGSEYATLNSPYATQDGVINWLKDCGIQLYNSVIGFVPDIISDPVTGGIMYTTETKKIIKYLVASLYGEAVIAANYTDINDFLSQNESFFIPFNKDLQLGVNTVFGIGGGLYNWQFNEGDFFTEGFTWYHPDFSDSTQRNEYNNAVANLPVDNRSFWTNSYFLSAHSGSFNYFYASVILNTTAKFKFFINTNEHTVNLILESGTSLNYTGIARNFPYATTINISGQLIPYSEYYNQGNYQNYSQIVEHYIGSPSSLLYFYDPYSSYQYRCRTSDFITEYLAGPSLETAERVVNLTDLNFDLDNVQYYEQLQDEYLLDIIGLIQNMIDSTDTHYPVFNNIYLPDGTRQNDPELLLVTKAIYYLLDENNPSLPVNLNDIEEYSDNTYLEKIKESAINGSSIIRDLAVFWYDVDPETTYIVLGCCILVLLGAFTGKLGHS